MYVPTYVHMYVRTYVCSCSLCLMSEAHCYMCFVTDKDLPDRNVLHVNYCPATCLLKDQSLTLTVFVAV